MTRRDTFTATPDAAEAFERNRGLDAHDPRDVRPSKADCDRDEANR